MDVAKRIFDVTGALLLLIFATPILTIAMLAIWLLDWHAPVYRAPRVGRGGRDFMMFKLRTMVPDADILGGRFAPVGDPRITSIGAGLRRFKIDELPQLVNVLCGEMSLVGPRPDVREGVDAYAEEERRVLAIRPGMTDYASLLFFHEAQFLAEADDPAALYVASVRPIKAALHRAYLERRSLAGDLQILAFTALSFIAREQALAQLAAVLEAQPASRSPSLTALRGWSGQMPRVS